MNQNPTKRTRKPAATVKIHTCTFRPKSAALFAVCVTLALITSLSATFSFPLTRLYAVAADSGAYARIITDDTPFYKDPLGMQLLFYLPYTYYVRVIDDKGTLAHVECCVDGAAAIDGYVPANMLFYDGQSVTSPYALVNITTAGTAVLYADYTLKTSVQYIFEGRTMQYYGVIPTGENSCIFYVSYNDRLGYVKESEVLPFEIALHPNELTFLPKEQPAPPAESLPEQSTAAENTFDLKIIIIGCLIFAGIIAMFVAFRKKPSAAAVTVGYYDENDYE